MLDVHPPQQTPHTWRDFFIHIVTIVVGLLIAIGLEQSVEWLHHRHEITQTREALRSESAQNRQNFAYDVDNYRAIAAELQSDLNVLLYLRTHPHASLDSLPSAILFDFRYAPFINAAYKVAQQTNVTALMPRDEVATLDDTYWELDSNNKFFDETLQAVSDANRIFLLTPDPTRLTPVQLDNEISLVLIAIEKNNSGFLRLHDISVDHPRIAGPIHLTYADVTGILHLDPTLSPVYRARLRKQINDFTAATADSSTAKHSQK